MKPEGDLLAQRSEERSKAPFFAGAALLAGAFLLGGSSKDYVFGLLILRPMAVIVLAIGLHSLTRKDRARFRFPLSVMAAFLGLIALHLIPLPSSLWMALPGRELAVAAGEAAGIEQPWRPISLVPYRGWNTFFAALVPASVMVCAVQLRREQHRALVWIVLAAALVNAVWAVVQSVSGFAPSTFYFGVPRVEAPNGLFANRNHLAAILVAGLPLLALVASSAKRAHTAVLATGCTAFAAFAIMITLTTGSRAGVAMALVALVASGVVWRARERGRQTRHSPRAKQRWVPIVGSAFGVSLLAIVAVILTQTIGFERVVSAGSGEVEEHRLLVWQTIIDFTPSYMPFGSGIGSFVEVFKVHEPAAMLGQSYWNHAHNDWLEWAMEGGVPALVLMATAALGWVVRTITLLRNSHHGGIDLQRALAGAIILLILGLWSLVDYPLRTPALASLAALCAVWVADFEPLSARSPAHRGSRRFKERSAL
ncbi:MAG: O-antigen ligase family protein [Pseudomonadota bacterium]